MNGDVENFTVRMAMQPSPITIGVQQSLKRAMELMKEHNFRHLPVQDGGTLKGIISDRDINFVLRAEGKDADVMLVADSYTEEPYTVDSSVPLSEVVLKMAQDSLGSALVTENGKLVGIFTTVDACRVLAEILSGTFEQ